MIACQSALTGERCAVKIIQCDVAEMATQARREFDIMKHLEGHRSFVKAHHFYLEGSTAYLVMERVDLKPVSHHPKMHDGDSSARVVIRNLATALDHLHSKNVIHRDLNPNNVLLDPETLDIKIIDFGISRMPELKLGSSDTSSPVCDLRLELTTSRVGTSIYRPPEFSAPLGQYYTQAVDLWGLGCVVLHLLSGEAPLRKNSKNCCGEVAVPVEVCPEAQDLI